VRTSASSASGANACGDNGSPGLELEQRWRRSAPAALELGDEARALGGVAAASAAYREARGARNRRAAQALAHQRLEARRLARRALRSTLTAASSARRSP